MKVRAKVNAGVPARAWIVPVDNDSEVYPKHKNGVLVHGGPLIIKGKIYEIPDDKYSGLKEIFEPLKEKKEKANDA